MMDVPTLVVFVSTAVALLVLSEQLAAAALRLASLAGDTYGGLVTATLSNSVEFLISVLALRKQMLRFVQVTLLGSVLFGSLLVPGVSFIARGIKHLSHLKQKHNKHAAGMHSMVLLLAAFSYGVPAAYNATSAAYGRCRTYCYEEHMLPLSRLVAAVLLPCYALMLVWSTITHAELLRRKRESVHFSEESQPHHLSPLLEEAEEEEADVALPSAVAGEESLRERRRVAHVFDASSHRGRAPLGGARVPSGSPRGSARDRFLETRRLSRRLPRRSSRDTPPRHASPESAIPTAGESPVPRHASRGSSEAATRRAGGPALGPARHSSTSGVCAEQLLATVDPAAAALGVTRHFIALVIIPLVGNVDTLLAATKCALLGNTELALALGMGSAIQVAMGSRCWCCSAGRCCGCPSPSTSAPSRQPSSSSRPWSPPQSCGARAPPTSGAVLLLGAYCIVAISYLFRSREEVRMRPAP
mmetsp:Transcript_20268/g.64550  ORF Transcript_20268/g.64550 Transcript_20268/m.64550 type:complete len:473 (-) Transcript_20268:342-1760(-)